MSAPTFAPSLIGRLRALGPDLAALALILVAAAVVSPWRLTTSETFMRLAIGRMTVAEGLLVARDPWIYSLPGLGWRNPEWLGDLMMWGVYTAAGERGLVALKLVVVAVGWSLLYLLGRRQGGTPAVLAGLILITLAGAEGRFTERADIHVYWMLPAYGLLLLAARRDRRWLGVLLAVGLVWANVHGSFGLGWVVVGAALAEALLGVDRDPRYARALALVLAVHPLLPFLSLDGRHAYELLIDHYRHDAEIKELIKEWVSPERLPATWAGLPLHLLGLIGLVSFLPRDNRRRVQGFILFAVGLVMAHSVLRFFPLFGMLAIPAVAANLARAGQAAPARLGRWRWLGAAALVAGGVALMVPAARLSRRTRSVEANASFPVQAARWLGEHAPPRSRLFGPYTGSQFLLWEAPALGLYIHPHFSFDGDHLVRFVREILPDPRRFESEVRRLDVNLALVGRFDETGQLANHLATSSEWTLVYGDGVYAVYARHHPKNQALLEAVP